MIIKQQYLSDDILEVPLPPSLCGVGHHGQHGVIKLLVLVVQEHQLGPEVSLLGRSQHLGGGLGEMVVMIKTGR